MGTPRTPHQPSPRALDIMRPSDAFSIPRASHLDDPARWMRPTFFALTVLATLAILLVAAPL